MGNLISFMKEVARQMEAPSSKHDISSLPLPNPGTLAIG